MLEDLSCLLATSDSSEGVDIPKRTYGEGYCRGAEVVWGGVAEDMTAISEPLLYGRNGAEEARIFGAAGGADVPSFLLGRRMRA